MRRTILRLLALSGLATGSGMAPAAAPAQGDAASTAPSRDVGVWVNTANALYYCPGTRAYGSTKDGLFLAERAAVSRGFRTATGKRCSQFDSTSLGNASPEVRVRVNLETRLYYCPRARTGVTVRMEFMSEAEAQKAGYRPAGGKKCF